MVVLFCVVSSMTNGSLIAVQTHREECLCVLSMFPLCLLLLSLSLLSTVVVSLPTDAPTADRISSLLHQAAQYRFGLNTQHTYKHDTFYRPAFASSSPSQPQTSTPVSLSHALSVYTQAATQLNSAVAWNAMAEIYMYGEGDIICNITLAVDYLHKAAALGHARAQHHLAVLFSLGVVVDPSPARSVLYDYFSSLSGNPLAQLTLGYRHAGGKHVPRHCDTAIHYYAAAAERVVDELTHEPVSAMIEKIPLQHDDHENSNGDNDAVAAAGVTHGSGRRRVGQSILHNDAAEDMLLYYTHAAQRGDVTASTALAHLYYYGTHGVGNNSTLAANYYQQSAQQGDTAAMTQLAYMMIHGIGINTNYAEAHRLLETVTQQHSSNSATTTSTTTTTTTGQAPASTHTQSHVAAKHSKTHAAALTHLGYLYFHGLGVAHNYTYAYSLFSTAAADDYSYADAQYHTAICFFTGKGITQSYQSALHWFTQAARASHTRALYYLAMMHRLGLGTMISCHLSIQLYKIVAERGIWATALSVAYRLYTTGYVESALMLYLRLAAEGHETAQANAAYLLYTSQGFTAIQRSLATAPQLMNRTQIETKRYVLAYKLYAAAADQGNHIARRVCGDFAYAGYAPFVVPDYTQASAAYRQAALSGNAHAAFNLGFLYETLSHDWPLAIRWYDSCMAADKRALVVVWIAKTKLSVHRWLRENGWLPVAAWPTWSFEHMENASLLLLCLLLAAALLLHRR